MSILRERFFWAFLGVLALFAFSVSHLPKPGKAPVAVGEVVLPPALQWVIYGGDPYLAANIEVTRVMVSDAPDSREKLDFFVRLHQAVVQLNPCHEDSFYLAAGFLPSGGAPSAALQVLEKAAHCRSWDAWAYFHLGFNTYLFAHDTAAAISSIGMAGQLARDPELSKFFHSVVIALKARSFDDAEAAIGYLRAEQKRTRDQSLRQSLERRIGRMQGLATLRNAQKSFEKRYGHPLASPEELVRTRILNNYPVDPVGLGYEFVNGRFELKEIRIGIGGSKG